MRNCWFKDSSGECKLAGEPELYKNIPTPCPNNSRCPLYINTDPNKLLGYLSLRWKVLMPRKVKVHIRY